MCAKSGHYISSTPIIYHLVSSCCLSFLMLYICTTANVHKKWTLYFIHSNYLILGKHLLFICFLYFIFILYVILYLILYLYTSSYTLFLYFILYFVLFLSYQMLHIRTTANVHKKRGITIYPLQLSTTW